ncbi:MAG: hypothetical protein ACOYJX_06960 [Acutalibacteraceae bacterium]|jgi:hypothetical protein
MISFAALSPLFRATFSLWALLLCLTAIIGIVSALFLKRNGLAAFTLLTFTAAYFLWQIIFDIYLCRKTGGASVAGTKLGELPWLLWLLMLAILSLAAMLLFVLNVRYAKTYITPIAIKQCADKMPCGICYWHDGGRVIFSNIYMNRLCIALTKQPLLNGNILRNAVSDGILAVDDRVWRFVCRDIPFDGECLHEMIASDITEEYAKTEALEIDTAEIARLNRELQKYTHRIDDIVRRQEILQAKVNIHDEMNRLMLHTVAADGEDAEVLDHIFSLWEKNTMLMCLEANEEKKNDASNRLERLAQALDIRLIWRASLPDVLTKRQQDLFFATAQEALINAAKHAGAEKMEIFFSDSETIFYCGFENDGIIPLEDVRFTGGLANLSRLAGDEGASLSVETGETFKLYLHFTK